MPNWGDRSRLITMTYALRFRRWIVPPGVTIATFGAPEVSVAMRHGLGAALPARPMALASAIACLTLAGWAWHESTEEATIDDHDWAGIWIGSARGMVLAGALFGIFGLWMLFENALGWRPVAIAVIVAVAPVAVSAATAQTPRRRHSEASWTGRSPETV
ncbi:hypothetical protein MSTO_40480 [Mycobacterium stomatepiae]|uniref:GDT1 family protein n=2 Tax=Mycobacterium stomatepiae TaxID=470076 RepID=A0A7I7QC13_9MYCO|nr:hypothetical protein MSTO_40480 [Mycobacterium stomatepiae]